MGDDTSVRVAVRVRPQSAKERIDMCQVCTSVTPGEPQVFLGKDKAFTYDFVHDTDSVQEAIYRVCCEPLIEGTFDGYNATIFAYGQTGSGKTYTMGTGFDPGFMVDNTGSGKTYSMGTGFDATLAPESVGIIPRAVEHLFNGIEQRQAEARENNEVPPDFKVNAQFMELYNEEIHDLLDTTRDISDRGRKSHIRIHEDAAGGIYTVGVTTRPVSSLEDTMQCLKIGALSRTTASTNMNAQSSRSHAVFTLFIRQQRVIVAEDGNSDKDTDTTEKEFETLTAKFHFVDLAGSERLKRTGATGDRQKEGISINCGLLALGNVISALGDKLKKGSHVPYRDSKLTRLLQDSLGGNSRTVMIACVSPSDRDFMETLNTLNYANRARNIKNRVVVNQDKTSKQISELRHQIMMLQEELLEYKQGKRVIDPDGVESFNDMFHENTMLQTENNNLRQRIKAMQGTIESLQTKNTQLLAERAVLNLANIEGDSSDEISKLIAGYISEIEELRSKLLESESMVDSLKKQMQRAPTRNAFSAMSQSVGPVMSFDLPMNSQDNSASIIEIAKQELVREKKRASRMSQSICSENEKDLVSEEEKQDHEMKEDVGDEDGIADNEEDGDEDGEEEEEDEMSSESDSDEDSDSEVFETEHLHEDLADLTCEISIKEKLIEELELSQKRLNAMKMQYEDKLISLQSRIKATEMERDQVLSTITNVESHTQDKTKKVKEEYEKKLNDMQNEVKKLQAAKKEHAKLLRNQSQHERQLKTLTRDLADMKRMKVKLINQIKEDSAKHRQSESAKNREVAKLKKEQRAKENKIRTLEAEKRQKELILRRKTEEVESLKRQSRQKMSAKAQGRVGKYTAPLSSRKEKEKKFSPKAAKLKWDNLEKSVSTLIVQRQTLSHMERDMERWLKQRNHLGKKLEKFVQKRERDTAENRDPAIIRDLTEQIESLRDNVQYVQDNINDCQSNIVQMNETKESEPDPLAILQGIGSVDEAKYILEHFINLTIGKGLFAAQKDRENKELMMKLHQERMDATFQRDMLQYLIKDQVDIDLEIDDSLIRQRDDESDTGGSATSSGTASPVDSRFFDAHLHPLTAAMMQPVMSTAASDSDGQHSASTKTKARRKTATPLDLLYAGGAGADVTPMLPLIETPEEDRPMRGNAPTRAAEQSLMPPPPAPKTSSRPNGLPSRSVGSGAPTLRERDQLTPSPSLMRKSYPPPPKPVHIEPSPTMRRRAQPAQPAGGSNSSISLSRQSSVSDNFESTPPTSPVPGRRGGVNNNSLRGEGNVFSRLTSMTHTSPPKNNRGSIIPSNVRNLKASPLIHSHTADGHTKAVLSIEATEELLFTSSKDRTAKVWDLTTGMEILSLNGHPNNVVSVKYSEETKLAYTVSTYFIKVWDIRDGQKCVKTLTSSGLTHDGVMTTNTTRQVTCPPGEININDISLNSTGSVLYSAAGNNVKIWDLRCFKSVGKLSGGHQAAVMVLAVDDTDTADGNICVVTGSKDHYIKIFEVGEDSVGLLTPKYNLDPPHYDGIQSLCLMGDLLFSGSRDMCIKKWDLAEQKLSHSINNAHKDWICGLAFMPGGNCLLSGCRGGYLKMWHIDNCQQLGEIKAHNSPVNAITTNSNLIFTASNDGQVKIWEPSWEQFPEQVLEEIFC